MEKTKTFAQTVFDKTNREGPNVGTAPKFKMHNVVGTVLAFKMHNIGTVLTFKMHSMGTNIWFNMFSLGRL